MPLYNLEHNRHVTDTKCHFLNKSQKIKLYHNRGISIEETIDSVHEWNPSVRRHSGFLNCANNPPFPEATDGEMYSITEDGTVGSYKVSKGDCIECIAQYSPEGYGEDVRNNWFISSRYTGENPDEKPIIPPDDVDKAGCVKTMQIDIMQSGQFDILPAGSIIRRVWIYINDEYYNGNEFTFNVNGEELYVPTQRLNDCIECMQGIKCNMDTLITVEVPNYASGSATMILEYYTKSAVASKSVKTIRFDLNNANMKSRVISIPNNAIITSCVITPDKCNPDALIHIYLNDSIIESKKLNSFYALYEYYKVFQDSEIYVIAEKINKGSVSIVLEYSV